MESMEFGSLFDNIINTKEFQSMKNYIHHKNKSCFEHTIEVAKKVFNYTKRHNLNFIEATRAALLHDFYLYDWHDKNKGFRLHGYKHPKIALSNARKLFQLTKKEEEIIVNHMFPLTLFHIPRCKESWIVCYFDKLCAFKDYFGGHKKC